MVCPKNMNSIRGKRYRLRIETLIILTYIEKISGDQAMFVSVHRFSVPRSAFLVQACPPLLYGDSRRVASLCSLRRGPAKSGQAGRG